MENQPVTVGKFYKVIQIIAGSMLLYTVVFLAVSLYLNSDGIETGLGTSDISLYILGGTFLIGGYAVSAYFSKKFMLDAEEKKNVKEKLPAFQTNLIIQLAFLEMPVLLNIVLFIITGDAFHVILAVIGLLLLLSKFPKREKVIQLIAVTDEDIKILNNNDAVI